MLPAKFGSIWPSSFRGEDFFNISQSETRIALGGHILTTYVISYISALLKKMGHMIMRYCHHLASVR
jgi:hypothetical protein